MPDSTNAQNKINAIKVKNPNIAAADQAVLDYAKAVYAELKPVVVSPPVASLPGESALPQMFTLPTIVQSYSGTIGSMILSGTDKRFVFAADSVITGTIFIGNMTRCVIDFQGAKSRNIHDGVKFTGGATDVWVRNFDIADFRNQAILGVGVNKRIWITDGIIANNNPDLNNPDWRTQTHAQYYGSQGSWDDGVLGNVKVINQRTGYGFQGYESCQRMIITSCYFNTPGTLGFRSDVGIATIWSGSSAGNVIANTIAKDCRGPLAVGGAGSKVPAVKIIQSAAINCGSYSDGQMGAVVGNASSDANIAGDPAYRLSWDTRTTGIGTF